MTLSRGLTNAAFVEYLEADERTNGAVRCVCLVDDTDGRSSLGDTLIEAIMQFISSTNKRTRSWEQCFTFTGLKVVYTTFD